MFPTNISGASLGTLPMVVSLIVTSGDLIADLYVVFFAMLIICEFQGATLDRGVQVKKIGAQIEVDCRAKGQR